MGNELNMTGDADFQQAQGAATVTLVADIPLVNVLVKAACEPPLAAYSGCVESGVAKCVADEVERH